MKPEDNTLPPRPSYLGVEINYPERDEPPEVDDIRTNLAEKFLLLGGTESDANQKISTDSKEHMQVYLRVRPFTASEIELKESQACVSIPDSCSVLVRPPQNSRLSEKGNGSVAQKFTFTHVFGPDTTQNQFFEGTIKQQVIDFMKGQNRLIFTYGVTNAGKTFTFQGTKDDAGILPRSMDMLFNTIQGKVYSKMDVKPHRCRDYIRLTKEQMKTAAALKNTMLRQMKDADPQCSIRSNNSRTSADATDFIRDEASTNSSSILSEFEDKQSEEFTLTVDSNVKFSVWVSFCEIYNECIYDLLDPVSGDKFYKRKTLRLAQDIKGFSFVRDLHWIEVSDAKEACKILALGKKFQSTAYTKLNSSSSRSHSIFTIRLLKIEDAEVPRVVKVSELALCDLAGSERCTKTQNEGERLKESGNINTSLLILGKCINALKTSQQSKIPQHVPFRESKLTHYLQSFFSGKGKVCMIVNICQSASAYDETLNVLKFSAVAQKVLLLESCQVPENLSHGQKSSREVSFIINNADSKMWTSRKRATVQWDSRLEDVLEDEDNEELEEDSEEEECLDCTYQDDEDIDIQDEEEVIITKDAYQKLLDVIEDLKTKLVNEKKDKLLMELKIREEVAKEFSEHFMQCENDFSERLQKEKDLMEERCDERMEIFQDLVKKCYTKIDGDEDDTTSVPNATESTAQEDASNIPLDGLFISMQSDLAAIKEQAVEAHHQITSIPEVPSVIPKLEEKLNQVVSELSKTQEKLKKKSSELESHLENCNKTTIQLQEAEMKLSTQKQQIDQLMCMIQQKESAVDRLKDLVSHWEAKCEDYEKTVNNIKGEMNKATSSGAIGRKRPPEDQNFPEDQPPPKKDLVEVSDTHSPTVKVQMHVHNNNEVPNTLQDLEKEKVDKEQYKTQVINLKYTIALLEEKLSRSDVQVTEIKSENEKLISELQTCKDHALGLEGTIQRLLQEVDQNKLNVANKVAQIKTIENKLDEFGKRVEKPNTADVEFPEMNDVQNGSQKSKVDSCRESSFYSAIEGLWKKCQQVLQELTKRNQLVQQLEQQLDNLNNETTLLRNENDTLQLKVKDVSVQEGLLKEKDDLIIYLRSQLSEKINILENQRSQEVDLENEIQGLKNEIGNNKQQIKDLECLLDTYKEKNDKLSCLEEKNSESASALQILEKRLEEAQMKHLDCEKKCKNLNEEKINLEQKIIHLQEKLAAAEKSGKERETQVERSMKEVEQLKRDFSQRGCEVKTLQLDLQRKEEDYTDLKEKLSDAKKQIQQVEKEISAMREEKKQLTNKVGEYEKLKNQMSCELELRQRTIQQLKKEHMDKEKHDDTVLLYQKACQDAQMKDKIIEDMKLTLIEQEQTQAEQDQALEAKVEEVERLAQELEEWKQKCRMFENNGDKGQLVHSEVKSNTENTSQEVSKLQDQLKEFEEKYISDRKKWLEEKMSLLAQAKESETHRNREMRKFAEDRERYTKQQTEMEQLTAQLSEKENTLLKWREERDQLLSALEVQLKTLLSSNLEKEREIENLKKCSSSHTQEETADMAELRKKLSSSEDTIKELQQKIAQLECFKPLSNEVLAPTEKEITDEAKPVNQLDSNSNEAKLSTGSGSSTDDCQSQDGSDTVLDSSAISTEYAKISRFPKPEMEIHFSPVRPNKMEVKHHGQNSPVTVKIPRTNRKRKSQEMEQDNVRSENKKNTIRACVKMTPSQSSPAINTESKNLQRSTLKKQPSTSSTMSGRKKDGTLQKLGDFLQSSPSIFQTKAKKLLETISAPKSTDLDGCKKENESKPKKSRKKLYNIDISAPLDIPAHPIVMDKNEKESDHLIMKRRLRTRTIK